MFNTPRGKGTAVRGRGQSSKGTPIKRGGGHTVQTRSTKPPPAPSTPAPVSKSVAAQANLIDWMKGFENTLDDLPSASDLEKVWNDTNDPHLQSAEQKVLEENQSKTTVRGAVRLTSNFNVFSSLSGAGTKDDTKNSASTSGAPPKKKKDVSVKQQIPSDDSGDSEDSQENEDAAKMDNLTLIHEIDIEPMDLNEAQKAMMQSHLQDIIDTLLPSALQITLKMQENIFRIYRGPTCPHETKAQETDNADKRPPIPLANTGSRAPPPHTGPTKVRVEAESGSSDLVRVSVMMKSLNKKVIYVIPRADDGTPISALKNYMRSKGKTDWGLRNLDYGTAKLC